MRPPQLEIDDYLDALRGLRVYYCPNPGNAGDALIALAAYELLRKHAINYTIVGYERSAGQDLRGETVIFGGGGSMNEFFDAAASFVGRYHRVADRLIILPQTVAGHDALLHELDANVELLCRDLVSFEYARKTATGARVLLANDLVFSLDVSRALAHRPAPKLLLPTRRRWIRNELELWLRTTKKAILDRRSASARVLNCFRGGRDRPDRTIPADNIDISALLARGVHPEPIAQMVAQRFLRFVSAFDTINTNRLHVGIAGALLGKHVNLYPNSYYKNKAVYEFSMKGRFPNVQWMGG